MDRLMCLLLSLLLIFGQLGVVKAVEKKGVLTEPAHAWVKFVTAVYEARQFAMSLEENAGGDPVEFEMYSKEIRQARVVLLARGELVEREFSFKSFDALFDVGEDHPLERWWEVGSREFSAVILQEFLGTGFDFQVMIANQRKGQEFDRDAPWTSKVVLPKSLMKEFEKSVAGLLLTKPE